jgi:hypothetical protein
MPPESTSQEAIPPQSLKEILYTELGSQFKTNLASGSDLSTTSIGALVALLGHPGAIPTDILSALEFCDPESEEVLGE